MKTMEQDTKKYLLQRGSDKKNIVLQSEEWRDPYPPEVFYFTPSDTAELNTGRGYGITASVTFRNPGYMRKP